MLKKVLRPIRRSLYGNYYYLARLLYTLRLNRDNAGKAQMLLVYQMGKVGSETIVETLQHHGLDMPIYNIHSLSKENLNRAEPIYRDVFSRTPSPPRVLWDSQYLRKEILENPGKRNWKVVTLVRDPIARNISHFFQYPNMLISESGDGYRLTSRTYDYDICMKIEEMDNLIELFLTRMDDHDWPLIFFDHELKRFLGIDVFAEEFPRERGYQIYRGEHVEVLLLRLENLNTVAETALSHFLGVAGVHLASTNIGSEKKSALLYRKFIDAIRLPDSYVQKMYTSRYAQHFYTQVEIDTFQKRWCKQDSGEQTRLLEDTAAVVRRETEG
jgi:hypothetical protein